MTSDDHLMKCTSIRSLNFLFQKTTRLYTHPRPQVGGVIDRSEFSGGVRKLARVSEL